MAVPARKVSKTRAAMRRAHVAKSAKNTTTCPNCGEIIKSHRVCPKCGTYKKVQVLNKEEKTETKTTKPVEKKETKKAEKKTEKKETKKTTKKETSKKSEK